jgi:hypothetical protein
MASSAPDLEAWLLNAAALIPRDLKTLDRASDLWARTLGDPEFKGTSAVVLECRGVVEEWADEITNRARVGPQHIRPMLFDAAARLRNLDPDVPRILTDAAAAIIPISDFDATTDNRQTDTKTDTPKKKRKMNVAAWDCCRIYREQKRDGDTITMKQVVSEYVETHGGSFDSIYRTVNDNPEQWRDG